ncbi:hypothetical protein QE422_001132 [Chryseobacterium sp. SORGH_AS 447]|uniref:hypothetical protein n=1 Tax=Chryseobacterium sp. SORGH_AS_0447 TaxID=3041769 RepID=UPI00278770A6|nr:hypothetical protein [Chryseobacterium sp. SORGH_AS_0447]MDQ1160764.1 hypothetical protein [Chryseobacterium sp. SORGH_AS_0447]
MIRKLITLGVFSISFFSFAQKISISPSVGYAWRLAKTSPGLSRDQKEYVKGLKSGVNFDIALRYEVKTGLLIGFKYSNYSASTSGRFSVMDNMGNVVSANISTKDHINFYGPEVTLTNDAQETRHKLFMSAALGAMTYTSKTENVKGKGTTFGAELDFAYQYQINKNILIGPKIGLSGGTLSKISYNGQTVELGDDQKESLTRLSLGAAATFRF